MKFGIVFLAALTVALLPAYTQPMKISPVIIPESMLEYGNEINKGNYGTIANGTLLYNGVRVPVVIKTDRLTGKLMHGALYEIDALR